MAKLAMMNNTINSSIKVKPDVFCESKLPSRSGEKLRHPNAFKMNDLLNEALYYFIKLMPYSGELSLRSE